MSEHRERARKVPLGIIALAFFPVAVAVLWGLFFNG